MAFMQASLYGVKYKIINLVRIVFWNTSESQNSEIVLGCLAMGEKRKSKSKQDKQQTNINHIVFVSL